MVKEMVLYAFDNGITHFDLANNYGRPGRSAEKNLVKILANQLSTYRDELIISTKAGYGIWEGPYGDGGSRKYLMASIDQSLKRLNLDYVNIFYSHRYDLTTPLIETMTALSDIVKQGKALYVGNSNYPTKKAKEAIDILRDLSTPCLICHPCSYMFNLDIERSGLSDLLNEEGVGILPFSPLAGGLLSNEYLYGIPDNGNVFQNESQLTDNVKEKY